MLFLENYFSSIYVHVIQKEANKKVIFILASEKGKPFLKGIYIQTHFTMPLLKAKETVVLLMQLIIFKDVFVISSFCNYFMVKRKR